MRSLPHNPDPTLASERRRRSEAAVESGAALRDEALRLRQGSFFVERSEQLAAAVDLAYLFGEDPRSLEGRIREAVSEFLLSLELGRVAPAPELRRWFYAALAAGDRHAAHALAALPPRFWYGADLPRLQAQCGFALLRGEQAAAEKHLDTLRSLTMEQPLPPDLAASAEEQASWCVILEGLVRRKGDAVQEGLRRRVEARARAYSSASRDHALDFEGIGLIALSEFRAVPVAWAHGTLPRISRS